MNASSIKNNGDYGISLFLFGLQYPRPSNLNTALAVDYLIMVKSVLSRNLMRLSQYRSRSRLLDHKQEDEYGYYMDLSQYRSRSRLLDLSSFVKEHIVAVVGLNTALAVDYLIYI